MAKKPASKRKKPRERDLSARERLFAAEYLKDLNGTKAAIRAGFSEKSAAELASRLLRKVKVVAEVDRLNSARLAKVNASSQSVLERLLEEANADLADLYNEDGSLKPVKDWPAIWRKGLVAGIQVEELFAGEGDQRTKVGEVTKIKLSERLKRVELIGRHQNVSAFKDKIALDVEAPLKELFRAVAGVGIRPRPTGISET